MNDERELSADISAYEKNKKDLEASHRGKWVVFYQANLVGVYDDFDAAAKDAVHRFNRGPYLIRQVGAPPTALPASVMYKVTARAAH